MYFHVLFYFIIVGTAFSHYFCTIFKAFYELIVLLLDLTHTHTNIGIHSSLTTKQSATL